MGCSCSPKQAISSQKQDKIDDNLIKTLNQEELALLRIMYKDVASRSPDGEMSLEDFLLFFHKNGYWGERLFKQFDTGNSNTITEQQFLRGIVKIFKTTQKAKIQLLFKFFSGNNVDQGIWFSNFLKMLYNYPKQEFNKILNDSDFVNTELKKCLVGLDKDVQGRRLTSLIPHDLHSAAVNGKAFRLEQSDNNSDRLQSKFGAKIINQLNKQQKQRRATLKIKVGENNVDIKTTSVHQLVKKFARSIFKNYQINENTDRMKFEQFQDWVMKHKNLYNDFFKGFHSQVWELDKSTNQPKYIDIQPQLASNARLLINQKLIKVKISLFQSILIVNGDDPLQNYLNLICLQGLSAVGIFNGSYGFGIEISHRNGVYQKKVLFFLNQQIQKQWIDQLKFFKGLSAHQLYEFKQQIGIGKFSVVYHCIEKSTGQSYAIKVIQSFKLDDEAKKIIAHESSIMSVMSHPLLVFFKQSIATKTHIYIVTQLVKGKDLFSFVKELKFLNEIEGSYILEQIIIGVRYIHSLGIVHRDLKPQNIMLEYDEERNVIGKVKIIDFGFANYLSNLIIMSSDDLWAGTPNYIAPEILKEQPFNEKIDVFAIGAILYFILSGNLPFNSADVGLILQKTIEGAFALNDKIWKGVSEEGKDLVSRLLQNQPRDRITLEDALKHPWFSINRQKREDVPYLSVKKHLLENEDQKINKFSNPKY